MHFINYSWKLESWNLCILTLLSKEFSGNVDLKGAWNYAFSAHKIQIFLKQGGAAFLQPLPGGQSPEPHIIFSFLASVNISICIFHTSHCDSDASEGLKTNCIPQCIYFTLFSINLTMHQSVIFWYLGQTILPLAMTLIFD